MPLKHGTETALVFFLGLMIALAGAAAAFLPPVSVAAWPWAVAFVIAVIYPLALYPLLRQARAEYEFRALHFAPALILLVWLVLDLLASFRPSLQPLQTSFTWGWSLPAVLLFFSLLLIFCLHVIRRRLPRTAILVGLLIPFVALSQWSQRQQWDRDLAMALWDGELTGSGNLAPSEDKVEEQWRAQLRAMQNRSRQLAQQGSSSSMMTSRSSAQSSKMIAVQTSSASSNSVKPPPKLPTSGFGFEGIALTLAAGFCTAVQRKTMLRSRG